jgi:hypothetical protein
MDIEEMRRQVQERIDQINNAPSLEELISTGEIIKHSRGYEVRSERARKAISPHIKSILMPNDKSKPVLFTLYRRTINKCKTKLY